MAKEELIEQFLAGHLDEADKLAFEERMHNSTALREEVNLHQQVISGIKEARAKELKALLNSTIISASPFGQISKKAILATLSVGLVTLILYFSIRTEELAINDVDAEVGSTITMPIEPPSKSPVDDDMDEVKESKRVILPLVADKLAKSTQILVEKKNIITAPIPPAYGTDSLNFNTPLEYPVDQHPASQYSGATAALSEPIELELDATNKKYFFHYKFASKKLFLYGAFVEKIYELIEINKKEPVLYLYYNGEYYYLNKKESNIVALSPIADEKLLKTLRYYRAK